MTSQHIVANKIVPTWVMAPWIVCILTLAIYSRGSLMQEKSKAVMERLQPLDAEETHTVCSHWLSQTAHGAQAAILQLLRGCKDAAELAAAESKLRAAIQNWKHTPQQESAGPQGARGPSAALTTLIRVSEALLQQHSCRHRLGDLPCHPAAHTRLHPHCRCL